MSNLGQKYLFIFIPKSLAKPQNHDQLYYHVDIQNSVNFYTYMFFLPVKAVSSLCHVNNPILHFKDIQALCIVHIEQVPHLPESDHQSMIIVHLSRCLIVPNLRFAEYF